jgi:RES domain-containing protein
MVLFRIAKTSHIRDLSGMGARLFGGRWNTKGVPVIYTATSRALATVEYLVHIPMGIFSDNLSLASLEIPDAIIPEEIDIQKLPKNWNHYEAPPHLVEIEKKWITSNKSLLLKVPSAVVRGDSNILINPLHRDAVRVKITNVERIRLTKDY